MPFPPPHQKFRITAWHDTLLAPRVRGRGVRPAAELARESGRGAPVRGSAPLCGSRHDVAAIAFDIKGPEIRVGRFGDSVPPLMVRTTRPDGSTVATPGQKEVALRQGDRLTLTTDAARANSGSRSSGGSSTRVASSRCVARRGCVG